MATQTFTATHSGNATFQTRVTITDGASGSVTYKIALFNTSPSSWQSYNLFSSGANSALTNVNIGSRNFSTNYTYDWKYSHTGTVSRIIGSNQLRGLSTINYRTGMVRQSGVGIPAGASIDLIGSDFVRITANATSTGSSSASFARDPQPAERVIHSGTITGLTPGSTLTISGNNDAKSLIGNATVSGSFTLAGTSPPTTAPPTTAPPTPPPTLPTPSFTDQSITSSWIMTRNFNAAPDRTVAASNATGYSVRTGGTGLSPTGWLTINSSGQLSGLPTGLGLYTFVVRASNADNTRDSNVLSLTINPPGNRSNGTSMATDLIIGKRYNGTQWINLSVFKRYNGTAWTDITN